MATLEEPEIFDVIVAVAVALATELFPNWTSVEASLNVVPSKQQLRSVPQQYAPSLHRTSR